MKWSDNLLHTYCFVLANNKGTLSTLYWLFAKCFICSVCFLCVGSFVFVFQWKSYANRVKYMYLIDSSFLAVGIEFKMFINCWKLLKIWFIVCNYLKCILLNQFVAIEWIFDWKQFYIDNYRPISKLAWFSYILICNLNKYAANAKLMKSTKCMTDCTKTKRSCCHWLTIYDETSEHPFDCHLFTQNNWFNYILANAHALKSCLNHAYAYSMDFKLFICVESFEKYSISLRPSVCWLFDICYSHAYQMIITYIVDCCIKYAWSAKNTTNHSR